MSEWGINWKKVAQEAEKVRDLALEAQAEATLARVKAEQERDAAQRKLKRLVVHLDCADIACPPNRGDGPCLSGPRSSCTACWDKWVNSPEDT